MLCQNQIITNEELISQNLQSLKKYHKKDREMMFARVKNIIKYFKKYQIVKPIKNDKCKLKNNIRHHKIFQLPQRMLQFLKILDKPLNSQISLTVLCSLRLRLITNSETANTQCTVLQSPEGFLKVPIRKHSSLPVKINDASKHHYTIQTPQFKQFLTQSFKIDIHTGNSDGSLLLTSERAKYDMETFNFLMDIIPKEDAKSSLPAKKNLPSDGHFGNLNNQFLKEFQPLQQHQSTLNNPQYQGQFMNQKQ